MEPEHFNWLEACDALVVCKHALDHAEFKSATHPRDVVAREDYILAWHAHHVAQKNEFTTRLALARPG